MWRPTGIALSAAGSDKIYLMLTDSKRVFVISVMVKVRQQKCVLMSSQVRACVLRMETAVAGLDCFNKDISRYIRASNK